MKSLMRYARLIGLLLAGLSVGLHWGLVQTLGWVSMTIEFSRSTSLTEALEMTFDGKHPCRLCKLAQKQGPLTESDAPAPSVSKSDIKTLFATLWADPILVLVPHPLTVFWPVMSDRAARLEIRPALPPPRTVV